MEQRKREKSSIYSYVKGRLMRLAESTDESATRAQLARLRRGVGKSPLETPEVWELTLLGLDEKLMGKREEPSYAEWAIHIALTLYSVHQQGHDLKTENMYRETKEASLGRAIARLVQGEDEEYEKRIVKRFNQMATSEDLKELSVHLRGLVKLMDAKDRLIPLNYPELAQDLYNYQWEDRKNQVRMKWGRDFYRRPREKEEMTNAEEAHDE